MTKNDDSVLLANAFGATPSADKSALITDAFNTPQPSGGLDLFGSAPTASSAGADDFGTFASSPTPEPAAAAVNGMLPLDQNDATAGGDKYALFAGLGGSTGGGSTNSARILEACICDLQNATRLVEKSCDSGAAAELQAVEQWTTYLEAIREIFLVGSRVSFSAKHTNDEGAKQLVVTFEKTVRYLNEHLKAYDTQMATPQFDPDLETEPCAVCCVSTAGKTAPRAVIDFGGKKYCSPCANFWRKRIETMLPI